MAKRSEPAPQTESAKLLRAAGHLLGGAYVGAAHVSQQAESGCTRDGSKASRLTFVVNAPHGDTIRSERYILTRAYGDFSDPEVALCDEIARGASILWEQFDPSGRRLHIRTAVNESGLLIGISRFLRAKAGLYWGAATFISLVQALTYLRYEGKACTSGFICLQALPLDLKDAFVRTALKSWHLEMFSDVDISVDHRFFDGVGSYRYVDGVTKYYVASLTGVTDGSRQSPRHDRACGSRRVFARRTSVSSTSPFAASE